MPPGPAGTTKTAIENESQLQGFLSPENALQYAHDHRQHHRREGTPIHTGTPAFARTGQAAVVAGFSATIASWIVWWLTHLPGLGVPSPAAAALLGLTLVISLAASARLAANPFKSAVFGGVIAGALNLLILGSILGEQADSAAAMQTAANRFRADAPAIILGYLLVTTLAGVIGGGLAASFPARASAAPGRWLARFAVIVVLSFFPLLFIGGAVTGTESGMAVPDAVTSYGAFSALLPMSMMAEPRIFLEHTHRLFGTLVGLNAIALVLFAFRAEKRMARRPSPSRCSSGHHPGDLRRDPRGGGLQRARRRARGVRPARPRLRRHHRLQAQRARSGPDARTRTGRSTSARSTPPGRACGHAPRGGGAADPARLRGAGAAPAQRGARGLDARGVLRRRGAADGHVGGDAADRDARLRGGPRDAAGRARADGRSSSPSSCWGS
jgi:hypothetical protein